MPIFTYNDENETLVTMEEEATPMSPDDPFRVLLFGDWNGSASRKTEPSDIQRGRRPIEIDRDNFDEVMKKLRVELHLDLYSDSNTYQLLRFTELDDFHPDRIFQQVPIFARLRDTRNRLMNPKTFDQAAEEVRGWARLSVKEDAPTTPEPSKPSAEPQGIPIPENLFDQVLAQSEQSAATRPADMHELNSLISAAVAPYLVQTDEAEQAKLVAAVDEATSELMRTILHHPQFQALESAWRAMYLLVSRIATDTDLKLYLYDISKDELEAELKNTNDLSKTSLYKVLVEETVGTPGGDVWAVACGNYVFGPNVADIAALSRIAKLAKAAGAPFIAHVRPEVLGCKSLAATPDSDNWRLSQDSPEAQLFAALRSLPEAAYIGLVLPRFLTRLPYGSDTDPTESFSFEEFPGPSSHDNYLWANPAFACALLLAQSFSAFGWDMEQGLLQDIEGLPMHVYEEDGERKIKPCAEALLTLNTAETILENGLMPLVSFKDSDKVRLVRFQSIASTPAPLRGRWL
jgi:type VI secretion system protein ImpC